MSHRHPTTRDRLVDVLAVANGIEPPLRVGTIQTIEKIYGSVIDALLDAGWEPAGFEHQYRSSQEALSEVMTEHRELRESIDRLAEEWEPQGFAEHPGRYYAQQLRELNGGEVRQPPKVLTSLAMIEARNYLYTYPDAKDLPSGSVVCRLLEHDWDDPKADDTTCDRCGTRRTLP